LDLLEKETLWNEVERDGETLLKKLIYPSCCGGTNSISSSHFAVLFDAVLLMVDKLALG